MPVQIVQNPSVFIWIRIGENKLPGSLLEYTTSLLICHILSTHKQLPTFRSVTPLSSKVLTLKLLAGSSSEISVTAPQSPR